MHRLLKHIALILAPLYLLAACRGGEEPVEDVLELDPAVLEFDALGGRESFDVISSEDWVANSGQSWAKVLNSSGKASSEAVSVQVDVSANTSGSSRTAVITVKTMSMKVATLTVSQSAESSVTVRGIADAADLQAFAEAVSTGASISRYMVDGSVVLLSDIDASTLTDWTPIGNRTHPFTGTFDGRGHCVSGLNLSCDASVSADNGFFGVISSATIKNLVLGRDGDVIRVTGTSAGPANAGGVCAAATSSSFLAVQNRLTLEYMSEGASGRELCLGGICGKADKVIFQNCRNYADILCPLKALAGGFAGSASGSVSSCANYGSILCEAEDGQCGPAWACGEFLSGDFITNSGYGHAGSYSLYSSDPAAAPDAMFYNAMLAPEGKFDTEKTTVDRTLDSYYDWKVDESRTLASGCSYTRYICTNVPRRVCVLELDLASTEAVLTTAYSDGIVPNPNANKNNNNGPKVRETLSQLCERLRSEGTQVIAGVNSGFFDSNDGISRGPHVENGEAIYVNMPSVRKALPNHDWALTVFDDGTASCGKKTFSGRSDGPAGHFEIGGSEYPYYSINDTIVRHIYPAFEANMYTSRYVRQPHPETLPSVVNALAKDAYYLVCRYSSGRMKVNAGYADAVVSAICDGRTQALAEPPYVSGDDEFVLSLSGATAASVASVASVGTGLRVRADMAIDGVSKPIITQNATMFQFMVDGVDASQTPPATHTNITTHDPVTFAAVDKNATRLWLIEVDGRQPWVSMGLKSYEMYRIALKLGAWNMTRFDGGGSSCMWVYDPVTSKGGLVSNPSDSKGERSCLNYMLITKKQ